MKEGFSKQEQQHIIRGKQILRRLWDNSSLKQMEVLNHLATQGLDVKKSTFSMWFSVQEGNFIRPKKEFIEPLIRLFCKGFKTDEQITEICDEVNLLLGYAEGPFTSEMVQNQVAEQLNENLERVLRQSQEQLSHHVSDLDWLLDEIEPKILEYDKGYPVIFIETSEKKLLKSLLGPEKGLYEQYRVEDGYEVPLSQIQSLEMIASIVNNLNEGSRLLRAYIERHILDEEGVLSMDFPRVEDFVDYTWEISDRLLYNNVLCKAVPVLKRTLLRIMTTCWGMRYILKNQTQELNEALFQNILERKGKTSHADINCSVAVYMGVLARQFLKSPSPERVKRGLTLFRRAAQLLEQEHEKLNTEQEQFYYKKELANLCYDAAVLMLPHQKKNQDCQTGFTAAMQRAHHFYSQVLVNVNLFLMGLTEQRANHLRIFYTISLCWVCPRLSDGIGEINKLSASDTLNEGFWLIQMGKAIAYAVLHHRSQDTKTQQQYKEASMASLYRAMLVPGLADKTRQEVNSDFVLRQLFPDGVAALAG